MLVSSPYFGISPRCLFNLVNVGYLLVRSLLPLTPDMTPLPLLRTARRDARTELLPLPRHRLAGAGRDLKEAEGTHGTFLGETTLKEHGSGTYFKMIERTSRQLCVFRMFFFMFSFNHLCLGVLLHSLWMCGASPNTHVQQLRL